MAGAGLAAYGIYDIKFADGNDIANGVPCYQAATIGGPVQADSTGTISTTSAWLPSWAQPNATGQLCFVHAPIVDWASAPATIAIRSLSEVVVTAGAGGGQYAGLGTAFPYPLTATVKDGFGNPVHASVTFTAPSSGPTASFAPLDPDGSIGPAVTVFTDDTGLATSSFATAGNVSGAFSVVASATGTISTAAFALADSQGGGGGGGGGGYGSGGLQGYIWLCPASNDRCPTFTNQLFNHTSQTTAYSRAEQVLPNTTYELEYTVGDFTGPEGTCGTPTVFQLTAGGNADFTSDSSGNWTGGPVYLPTTAGTYTECAVDTADLNLATNKRLFTIS